ncbi:hypothetical protein BJX63DRAFT_380634 [Aspergillus granulosus]|uniref:Major facilitator superfamily (MFS) profile domain-containing protein n=1 Tax=Aspergillus granulosus TaxID=176169 RepID=A0ABR4HY20_9EURO
MNLLMFFPLISIFTLGFDGSMMNGLQAVEGWRSYFGEPRGATLGLFNGAYPIGGFIAVPFISILNDGLERRWGIVTRTFPETNGPTLEEIAVVFDGPSAAHGGVKDIDLETQGRRDKMMLSRLDREISGQM